MYLSLLEIVYYTVVLLVKVFITFSMGDYRWQTSLRNRVGYTDRMSSITEDDLSDLLANPYYAISFHDYLFSRQKPAGADEDWVLLNAKLMDDIGAEEWLIELLDALSLSAKEYDGHDIINPSLAVPFSDRLRGHHEPLATREQWVRANIKQIEEIGSNNWLWRLLDVLQTGGPETD